MKILCMIIIIHLVLKTGNSEIEEDKEFWYREANDVLHKYLESAANGNMAHNVILFLGDGMGMPTVTAARILKGAKDKKIGERAVLAFEKFPYTAFSKTYTLDSQVGDSGACATALLCGVKGHFETVGLDSGGKFEDCESSYHSGVPSLMDWAQEIGKATGFVTNTRVTHATPAALYSHVASRYWEDDSKIPSHMRHSCKDIARQLLEDDPGRNVNVILGGGRRHFSPKVENEKSSGRREDGRNLIDEWKQEKKARSLPAEYVSNKQEFDKVDPLTIDYLLGLFADSHMDFNMDRNKGPAGQPSLAEMTKKAIQVLKKNPYGFFLMVEAGRMDHAHHYNNAARALDEVHSLEAAIEGALQLTEASNTLVVVTSDHSHTLSFGGYPKRGSHILGLDSKVSDVDGLPYTTLLYGSGPGHTRASRHNLTKKETVDKNYIQLAAVPRQWATHGGEDVPVWAAGAMAHLFRGTVEQTYIAHAIAYAACMGNFKGNCSKRGVPSGCAIEDRGMYVRQRTKSDCCGVHQRTMHWRVIVLGLCLWALLFQPKN